LRHEAAALEQLVARVRATDTDAQANAYPNSPTKRTGRLARREDRATAAIAAIIALRRVSGCMAGVAVWRAGWVFACLALPYSW